MDSQKVTIVMVSQNNYGNLLRALDSIVNNSRLPNRIVIGDNDSTDGTYNRLCKHLGAIPINPKKPNPQWPPKFDTIYRKVPLTIFRVQKQNRAVVINACIRMYFSQTSIYGILDKSSWYNKDAIRDAIQTFMDHRHSSCVVSNTIRHFPNGISERVIKRSYDAQRLFQNYEYDENMFIASASIQKLGMGFDGNIEHMFDYDMMLRLSRIGLIYHLAGFLYETDYTLSYNEQLLKRAWAINVRTNILKKAKAHV